MKNIIFILFFAVLILSSNAHSTSTEQEKYLSPDGRYQAFVSALSGVQSDESIVIIKTKNGKTIFSKSYGSEDGHCSKELGC
jgi:hypothetical protein